MPRIRQTSIRQHCKVVSNAPQKSARFRHSPDVLIDQQRGILFSDMEYEGLFLVELAQFLDEQVLVNLAVHVESAAGRQSKPNRVYTRKIVQRCVWHKGFDCLFQARGELTFSSMKGPILAARDIAGKHRMVIELQEQRPTA
jgi:hypothetical protein